MKKLNGILWGIVLIALGVIFALNALDIADIDILFDGWWTLFIIVPCTIGLFSEKGKTGNIIGLLIGVFLLLCCQGMLDFDMFWKLAVPAIIVIIGVKLLLGGIFGGKSAQIAEKCRAAGEEIKNECAVFSGRNIAFNGEAFYGAELTAVFGGVKCDLRGAVIEKDCVINACAIFGGVELFLPENVNVKVKSNSIFGGISDKKHRNIIDNAVTVYINGTCMFGGVDIK